VTANRCQNQDIFFALRGGGGNTFGVNMEVTYRAHPRVVLQVANFVFVASSIPSFNAIFPILTQNANKWAEEGWGGYINLGPQARTVISVLMATPNLNYEDALTSMAPLFAFANSSNTAEIISANVTTSNSFYQAYQQFILNNEEAAGIGAAIASRLIPKSLLSSVVCFLLVCMTLFQEKSLRQSRAVKNP
jgi:hypothetical protein